MWRSIPLGNGGSVVTKGGVVNLVNEDSEEGSSLLASVRLELGLDIDDEGGSDSGEQTSLLLLLACGCQNSVQDSQRSELYLNPRHASS